MILTAGMSAQYSMENKEITVVTEEDVNKLAWRTGQLRFMETPLDKVIEDLSDYYQVKIANQTKNEGARLTATFNNQPWRMSCRLLTRHWTLIWFPLRRNKIRSFMRSIVVC